MKHGALEIIIAILVLGWVLVRQLQPRPLVARTLFILPAVLAALGLLEILHGSRHGGLTSTDIDWIAIDLVAAVLTGLIRAPTVRLFERERELWRRGGPLTLGLWVLSIAVRAGIDVIGHKHHAGTALDHSLLLSFGLSLAAQYAALIWRGQRTGVPFALATQPTPN